MNWHEVSDTQCQFGGQLRREGSCHERSELQAEWDEVFNDRQVLGDGPEGGRVCVGSAAEGPETEVVARAAGGEEGEVNGRDAVAPVGGGLDNFGLTDFDMA